MYKIFKKYVDLANNSINDYYFSGIPYKINMYGNIPKISWQPNSLKQAIDTDFGFMLSSEKSSKDM